MENCDLRAVGSFDVPPNRIGITWVQVGNHGPPVVVEDGLICRVEGKSKISFAFFSMKMDGDGDDGESLSEFNSFLINQEIHANIIELSKKRKLQGNQLGLPLPKHRFGDRISGSEPEEQVSFTCIIKENTDDGFSVHGPAHLESSNDSNCFNSATYLYPEIKSEPEFVKLYSYKQSAKYDAEYPKAHIDDQPSTSSGSCGSNSFNTMTHCLDSMCTEKISKEEGSPSMDSEPSPATLKDGLKYEEDQLPDLGKYMDYICSEPGSAAVEQYSDVEDNEIMLYCNEAPSNNTYVLSSGRRNTKQDADQMQVRKPTIDQEFEQYFSMLML